MFRESTAALPWRSRLHTSWPWLLSSLVVIAIAAGFIGARLHRARMEYRLLAEAPAVAGSDPALVGFAMLVAKPLFARNCAVCHGSDMHGNTASGAPNLTDPYWLWADGSIRSIDRTLLYGIRTGLSKTRNVTEMPAFGLQGRLDAAQVDSLVQYLFKLNGRPYQALSAIEGEALFRGPAGCNDCHGPDGVGNSDYGAPDLIINVWNNGGDEKSIFDSIYYGRHRIMPAWFGVLSLMQIRALSVYVYAMSHQIAPSQATAVGADADPLHIG